MEEKLKEIFLKQVNNLLDEYVKNAEECKYEDLSDLPPEKVSCLFTKIKAAVNRISGKNSEYFKQIEMAETELGRFEGLKLRRAAGILAALRDDIGFLNTFPELIRSELFSDFLDMATYLLEEGLKDPAAVIAGGTLEEHLRKLCEKNGIDTLKSDKKSKKADTLNSELAAFYSNPKGDLKSVTAWLDLRNDAAHRHYERYTLEQVKIMIMGIREFMGRNPA